MIGTPANFPTRVSDLVPGDLVIVSRTDADETPSTMLATVVKAELTREDQKWTVTLRANDQQFTRRFTTNWQNAGKPMQLMRVRFISVTPIG